MADVPPGAEEKNRYKDILPSKSPHTISYTYLYIQYIGLCAVYSDKSKVGGEFFFPADPQTRVSLFLKFAVANSDYINANFIRVRVHYMWTLHSRPKTNTITEITRAHATKPFFPHCYVLHGMGYGVIGITEASFTWYQNNHNIWHLRLKSP